MKILFYERSHVNLQHDYKLCKCTNFHLRGRSDMYLASSPEGVTIANIVREIYYRVSTFS